ncbi:MAG TPA: hypothetical protein VLL08_25525 [Kineosporiaceae bacterium]|nr:hypothetical protein [Kineosporiaceae bacterium]
MKRIVIAALLITSVLVPAVVTGLSATARAAVVAVSLPTTVSISDRTLTFSGTVRVRSTTTGLRSASLWFHYPDALSQTRIGTATSRRPGFLVVTASLDAARIVPGLNTIQVQDDADGNIRTLALDLRRRSRVTLAQAAPRTDGQVALVVKVSHYDPKLGRFAPSRLSPVRLQEKVGDVWVPLAQVTTRRSGLADVLIKAARGAHEYRAIRPDGATVLAATSKTLRTGRIPNPHGCRLRTPGPVICSGQYTAICTPVTDRRCR